MGDFLNTKELAAALNISVEAARQLMKQIPGVIALPALSGNGKRIVRRLPRAAFDAFILRRTSKLGRKS